jgi:hypothetical protein
MNNNTNILDGLTSSIFDDNDAKFEREQSFGRKLMITAWAVEILAASIGLIIAFTMAYDAYNNSEVKNVNTSINALLGALPFLLIAIIEPTKIPLAGGLYKVKNWGWKILILLALLGLTAVTFETLFTGLERQVTNVTAQISRGKNSIQVLEKQNSQTSVDLAVLLSINLSEETQDLDTQIQKNRELEKQQITSTKQDYENRLSVLEDQRSDAYERLDQIKTEQNTQYQNKVDAIQSSLTALNQQIQDRNDTVRGLRQSSQELSRENVQDELIQRLESNIDQIKSRIEEVERWLNSNEGEQIKKAQRAIGVVDDGKIGANTRRNFDSWRASEEQRIDPLRASIQDRLSQISRVNEQRKNSINGQIAELSEKTKNLESQRAIKELELQSAKIGNGEISDTRSSALITKIDQIDQEIKTLNQRHDAELEQIRSSRNALQQDYELSKKQIETKSLEARKSIPKLEELLAKNNDTIMSLEADLTEKAQQNQIYRFAQKVGKYEDILLVKEKDLTFVSILWFGSIALVCATVGTILALISNIMTDPDAFVQKQQNRNNNKLARSIRKMLLAFRKRLQLKQKIIKVDVPIEVEKIVEIEVIVEKIVEKPVVQEVDKLVPEIVPIPVFVPNGGDVDAEVQKVADHYADLNKKVKDSFNQTARKHEDYEPK